MIIIIVIITTIIIIIIIIFILTIVGLVITLHPFIPTTITIFVTIM